MVSEPGNRRMGESAKRRTNVNTDERKQNDKANGQVGNTKKAVRHFRDLNVYQNAFETGLRVYGLSKKFPDSERYALTDQIRRSSRAVCRFSISRSISSQRPFRLFAIRWRRRRRAGHHAFRL
jgi:hypothetical protein